MSEEEFITSTHVKHFAYCPKIIYFENVLHLQERHTESMEYGKEVHEESIVSTLVPMFKAKKLIREAILESKRLKLKAKIDYIIVTKFDEYIPVELKWSSHELKRIKFDHKIQLVSISLLIDEKYSTTVKRGVLYYINEKKVYTLPIMFNDKKRVMLIISEIWNLIKKESEPEIDQPVPKCLNCGFKNYCKPFL
jgi:CRISPR-associated exonuclease Cas4